MSLSDNSRVRLGPFCLLLVVLAGGRAEAQEGGDGWYALSTVGLGDELTTLAISHRNPNFVLVGTVRGRILATRDGGSTWDELWVATDRSLFYGRERQPDPSWEYAPGLPGKSPYLQSWLRRSGLATSGVNMAQLLSQKGEKQVNINWIEVDWNDENTLYVGLPDGLYRSRDGGRSFVRIFQGESNQSERMVTSVATDPNDRRRILVGTYSGLFTSEDGGLVFKKTMDFYLRDSAVREIWFDPNQPKLVHVALVGSAMASPDAGVHWITTHWNDWGPRADVQSFSLGPGNLRLIGTRDGLYASWQGGEMGTWQRRGLRFVGVAMTKVLATRDPKVWYAVTDHAVWVTEDAGNNWRKVFQGGGHELPRWIAAFGGQRKHLWFITNRQVFRVGPPPAMRRFDLSMRADPALLRMPSLRELGQHVLRRHGLRFTEAEHYRERSYWAAMLPSLTLSADVIGYEADFVKIQNHEYSYLPYYILNQPIDGRFSWTLFANWDLGRLILSKERLPHWGRIERNQSGLRQDLLDRVHRLYLEYRRNARILCIAPPADYFARQHLESRLQEIGAYLDAISAGYWSKHTNSPNELPNDGGL